jgi:bisphosphoglycerate-dependent phosphoglycerate mutase
MERKVFINADSIVTVTDELKEKFISIHGESIRKKIEVIPNGFDFDIKEEKIYNEQLTLVELVKQPKGLRRSHSFSHHQQHNS